MRGSATLPAELIDQVFEELVALCTTDEVLRHAHAYHPFWACTSTHPLKAFGNSASSFRARVQALLWTDVKVEEKGDVALSWKLYEYLRCVDSTVLNKTRAFTYESYCEEFDVGGELEVRDVVCGLELKKDAANGLALRKDGSIDLEEHAPLVPLANAAAQLGYINNESDVHALLRFNLSKLKNLQALCWRSQLYLGTSFHGVSLVDTIVATAPNLKSLWIDESYLGGGNPFGNFGIFKHLEEARFEVDLEMDVNYLGPFREYLVNARTLRRFITSLSGIFADADVVVAIATLEITALEPSEENEKGHLYELGMAAAALRPALLALAQVRSPPQLTLADVTTLVEHEDTEALAEWLSQEGVALRIVEAFNKSIEGL